MTSPDRRPSPGRMLRRALGARRADLVAASVLYSLHQFGEAMVPVIIGAAVGTGIAQRSAGSILLWLIVLGADFVLLSLCYRFGARASMRAKQHTAHRVRSWLMARILDQAGGVTQAPGELLIRTSSDAGRIGALAGVLASAIAASVVLVVTVGLLLWYSVLLGVVIVVGTALLLLAVGAVARRLARSSGAEQHAAGRAAVLAEDLVRGLRVLKGIGAERTAQQDYARASGAALVAALRAVSSRSEVAAVSALLTGVYVAIVAAIGGWLALSGSLGLGQLVSALGLAQFLIGPLQVLASTGAASARARASALRVQEILEAPTAVRGPEAAITDSVGARCPDVADVSARDPYVEVRGVPLAGSPITFTARAGELTGVVAEAGAAAHLARLLARDQDPPAGAIVLGGVELSRMPLDELRARMLVSPHEAALFPGSIDDNVALAAADPAARDRGSRAALADQVIRTLPEGGAWQVGERGQYLSGGQRQRVALARAIAAEPEVLVLHDPTTAVDAATEDLIAERLALARAGMTTIVITSAPAVLSRCAQVVVLGADGVVSGRHADLLQRHAVYRRLVIR